MLSSENGNKSTDTPVLQLSGRLRRNGQLQAKKIALLRLVCTEREK
jgi:hypothetical protein